MYLANDESSDNTVCNHYNTISFMFVQDIDPLIKLTLILTNDFAIEILKAADFFQTSRIFELTQ